ncbi:hypothetical protein ACNJYA_09425 [Bradyrhizobium sp. DASA03068]|uniref:hypothetical protein n=1 Tax=Bradyrhizobium sp. BLXBL-01 TaxID=3395915 RepID=UPI003F6EECC0
MILKHPNPRALAELFPHIERLLFVMGSKRINDAKHIAWESEEYGPYVIRFVLVQLRPGQRPS